MGARENPQPEGRRGKSMKVIVFATLVLWIAVALVAFFHKKEGGSDDRNLGK